MRRQFCQQDGAEQQRERAAPSGHVCASAHGGVSGAQSRFAGADCPAGQPCRPADRRARCPADRRARCPADRRVESVHVSPPLPCGSVCTAALFHAGRGKCPAGACLLHPRAEPGRHLQPQQKRYPAGGRAPHLAGRPCRCGVRRGGLSGWLPADRAVPEAAGGRGVFGRLPTLPLVCFVAPIPPAPFPAGRGRLKVYFAGGYRPRHPCTEPSTALTAPATQAPYGGAGFFNPDSRCPGGCQRSI